MESRPLFSQRAFSPYLNSLKLKKDLRQDKSEENRRVDVLMEASVQVGCKGVTSWMEVSKRS